MKEKYLRNFRIKKMKLEETKNFDYSIGEKRLNNINDEIRVLETLIDFLEEE